MTWISTHPLDPYRPLDRIDAGARACRRDVQAADGRGRRARLEVAVHLPGAGHRHGQRTGRAGRPADRLQDHRLLGDELVLHPGAGRPDLRHAGHGDEAARRDQPGRRLSRASRPTTAAPASPACASSSTASTTRASTTGSRRPRQRGGSLDRAAYLELEKPSEHEPVRHFAHRRRRPLRRRSSTCASSPARCA